MNNRLCASYNELQMKHSNITEELEEKSAQCSDLLIDWEQNYNHMCAQETQIRQLEQDKKNMLEEHRRALVFAADRISAAERKLAELQHQQGTITPQQPPKKRTRRPRVRNAVKTLQEKDDGRVDVDGEAFDRACETERLQDYIAVKTQQNKDDGRTNMGQTSDRASGTE
jgi:chromosome segregation ATPase